MVFRDVYDHLYRATEMLDTLRDLSMALLETHLAIVANRTNQVMRVLTTVATFILPLSLVTGWFGMNFRELAGPRDRAPRPVRAGIVRGGNDLDGAPAAARRLDVARRERPGGAPADTTNRRLRTTQCHGADGDPRPRPVREHRRRGRLRPAHRDRVGAREPRDGAARRRARGLPRRARGLGQDAAPARARGAARGGFLVAARAVFEARLRRVLPLGPRRARRSGRGGSRARARGADRARRSSREIRRWSG